MSGSSWKSEPAVYKLEYDFAADGGAVGTIALGNLPDDFVVVSASVSVDTTLVGATATVTLGEDGGGDADGYFLDLSLPSAGDVIEGGGALLTDSYHRVVAAQDGVLMTVGTAALTAGKFKVLFMGYQA